MLRQEFIDPSEAVVVGGQEDILQSAVSADLDAKDGFYTLLCAELYEVPGVAGGVYVGECQGCTTDVPGGIDELSSGKGTVSEAEPGLCEIHKGGLRGKNILKILALILLSNLVYLYVSKLSQTLYGPAKNKSKTEGMGVRKSKIRLKNEING